jgi:hypothetical protein
MNSGIVSVIEDETHYDFYGSSGSIYRCNKEMYGTTAYGYGVIDSYKSKYPDTFFVHTDQPDIMSMDWIIKN